MSCAAMLWLFLGECPLQPIDVFYLAILYKVGAKLLAAGVAKEDWAGLFVGPIELRSTSMSS